MENLKENLKGYVIKLSEEIGERSYYSYENLEKSANFIIEGFRSFGYSPEIQKYKIGDKVFRNIIAEKKSESSVEIIIIGAHYDAVYGSRGADDNASGVAVLLELSRLLKGQNLNKTIRFVAFTNEEPPFFKTEFMGSRVYCRELKKEKISSMICLESVGYYSDERNSQSYPPFIGLFYPDAGDFIGVVGNIRSRGFVRKVREGIERNSNINVKSIAIFAFVPGVDFSDHSSFWKIGVKAVMITDTAFYRYEYYHTPQDTYEKLDYQKMAELTKGLVETIKEI